MTDGSKITNWIRQKAISNGFDSCGFTSARLPEITKERLADFIEADYHGEMAWLDETKERRASPDSMWDEAQSAIILGVNYGPDHNPLDNLEIKTDGNISVYARGRDYHEVVKGRLKQLAGQIAAKWDAQVKVFVDTAPLMEKPLAQQAGIGWQGKHTNLVSRDFGSWLFLGVILVNHSFEYDSQEKNYCGSCTKCLDICPTDAFYKENKLDASKCISYLTIEHRNAIPKKFRTAIGNRIFGCDDCLAICPWNKYAKITKEIHFNENKYNFNLNELLNLSDQEFRKKFTGSPIKRIGRDRFIRNCCIAAGNSKNKELISTLVNLIIKDQSFLVRGAAIWALQQLDNKKNLNNIKKRHLSFEKNKEVLAEWYV